MERTQHTGDATQPQPIGPALGEGPTCWGWIAIGQKNKPAPTLRAHTREEKTTMNKRPFHERYTYPQIKLMERFSTRHNVKESELHELFDELTRLGKVYAEQKRKREIDVALYPAGMP